MDYSVLMSVYYKEKADNLRQSMQSMFQQTVPTNDFVLICDGPLNDELDAVIREYSLQYPDVLNVVRLQENKGLGNALRTGVTICKNELIARMDSDDISRNDRCEKELGIFELHPELSIVGSNILEFSTSYEHPDSLRKVPRNQEEIIRFAKKRSPFNHPSVMYKKSAVIGCGNYKDIRYMQDYYLWIDMLINGCKGYNIQEPLVFMRADDSLFKRRSGKIYRKIQIDLFKYMKTNGFISLPTYLTNLSVRFLFGLLPNGARKSLYQIFLRKSK